MFARRINTDKTIKLKGDGLPAKRISGQYTFLQLSVGILVTPKLSGKIRKPAAITTKVILQLKVISHNKSDITAKFCSQILLDWQKNLHCLQMLRECKHQFICTYNKCYILHTHLKK